MRHYGRNTRLRAGDTVRFFLSDSSLAFSRGRAGDFFTWTDGTMGYKIKRKLNMEDFTELVGIIAAMNGLQAGPVGESSVCLTCRFISPPTEG